MPRESQRVAATRLDPLRAEKILDAEIAALRSQLDALRRENADLRAQLTKLLERR